MNDFLYLMAFANMVQWAFNGIGSFAHLDYVKCLTNPQEKYDIAIIGAPFDTAVSFRPGKQSSHNTTNNYLLTFYRRPIWPQSHKTSLFSSDVAPRIQPARKHQSLPELGENH